MESNHRSELRRIVYSPLYERDIILAGVIRFELMMTISKTVALGQLGDTPTEKFGPLDKNRTCNGRLSADCYTI